MNNNFFAFLKNNVCHITYIYSDLPFNKLTLHMYMYKLKIQTFVHFPSLISQEKPRGQQWSPPAQQIPLIKGQTVKIPFVLEATSIPTITVSLK